jgi:dTDP-4-amino-4,6-dideoxygalactose transaminase
MTTGGEGGMVTTNDKALWAAMWAYKDHGKSYSTVYEKQHPPGFRWLHESFGTNWRMLEMQAVIGRIQLKKMPQWTAARAHNAKQLAQACAGLSLVRVPNVQSLQCASTCNSMCVSQASCAHAFYKFYAYINTEQLAQGWSRDRIVETIIAQGVPCYQGTCSEVYLEKAFDDTGWRPSSRLPNTKVLGETSIMLLVHPTLSNDEIAKSSRVLRDVLMQASL